MKDLQTIPQIFENWVSQAPDKVAFMHKVKGAYRNIKLSEAHKEVINFASGLKNLGIEKGDKLCLFSETRYHWAVSDLAILALGAVNVPIYATNTAEQAAYIINDSEAKAIIVSTPEQAKKIISVKETLSDLKHIILIDYDEELGKSGVLSFEEILKSGGNYPDLNSLKERIYSGKGDDPCTFIYTSGTTGEPKGVILTHNNFIANIKGVLSCCEINNTDICLSFLPLSHVLERMAGYYTMLYAGAIIAYAESPETVGANLVEIKPTVMVSVPRVYEKIYAKIIDEVSKGSPVKQKIFWWAVNTGKETLQYTLRQKPLPFGLSLSYKIAFKLVFSKLNEKMGGRVKFFISGGAPLSKELGAFLHAAGIVILEGYGLTETAPVLTCNTLEWVKLGSVGRKLCNVELKIADDGEILVKGPNIMTGYYKKEEATKEAFTSDGWFKTGDIGYLDEDGFLFITDRKKDLIVTSGGKNIAPQFIENMLKLQKFIDQAVILGDKRNYLAALIVPKFESLENYVKEKKISCSSRRELVRHPEIVNLIQKEIDEVNLKLARYESIKKFAIMENEFTQPTGELTPTLKVKRKVVYNKYRDLIETLYME